MEKIILLLGILIAVSGFVSAESVPDIEWNRTYASSLGESANTIKQASDGGYVFGGSEFYSQPRAYVMKLDSNGEQEWIQNSLFLSYYINVINSIEKTSDRGYIMTGEAEPRDGSQDVSRVSLTKLNSSGAVEWTKKFGETYGDVGRSVQQTSDGGFIVSGNTQSFSSGNKDFYVLKTDQGGNLLWNRTYGDSWEDVAYSIEETYEGGFVVAGKKTVQPSSQQDFWLIKIDSEGNEEWNKTYGGSNHDWAYSVQQTSDNGYILGGWTYSYSVGGADFYVVKTDSLGNMEWNKTFGGIEWDEVRSVRQTEEGDYVLAGWTRSFNPTGHPDAWLVKIDNEGNLIWDAIYGELLKYEEANSMEFTSDGGYILAGYKDPGSHGSNSDFWIVKLKSTLVDNDEDGFTSDVDCDDNNPEINPDADDSNCDGVDDNCNNISDDEYVTTPTSCGLGVCASDGLLICVNGAEQDTCTPGEPTAEICDNIDNDCDGIIDNSGNALCDDGLFCNGEEVCAGLDGCQAGIPPDCDDIVSCTDDSCNEEIDDCENIANDNNCPVDDWFNIGYPYWVPISQCNREQRQDQEYQNHYCDLTNDCQYNIEDTRYIVISYEDNDEDDDGICDDVDKCLGTVDWYAESPKSSHYDSSNMNLTQTYGCSGEQILSCKPGENKGELKFGLSQGTLNIWMVQDPDSWALDCQVDGKVTQEGASKPLLSNIDEDWLIGCFDLDNDDDGMPDSEDYMTDDSDLPGSSGYGTPDWFKKK